MRLNVLKTWKIVSLSFDNRSLNELIKITDGEGSCSER